MTSDTNAERFEAYRPLMFSIAYRMLGSAADAEDMVQKAYLRYQTVSPDEIVSHQAFLSTVVTRLCLNHLELARTQREHYVGEWLPEPLLTPTDEQFAPARRVELHESLSIAFLSLLEQLTPLERAVFLLREVFDYEYAEIATMIDKEESACRQLFSRAKKHIAENRPRFKPTPEAHRQIFNQFIQTITDGNVEGLLNLLSEDVVLHTDSGGKFRGALQRPLHGRENVSRFLLAAPRLQPEQARNEIAEVNGEPALVVRTGSETRIVMTLTIDQGHVSAINVMGNPDKLKWVNPTTDSTEETSE
jgi:RNA polymerase sigma-70 factor (ECF subfamily)